MSFGEAAFQFVELGRREAGAMAFLLGGLARTGVGVGRGLQASDDLRVLAWIGSIVTVRAGGRRVTSAVILLANVTTVSVAGGTVQSAMTRHLSAVSMFPQKIC